MDIYFNEAIFKGIEFNKIKVSNLKTHRSVSTQKIIKGNLLILRGIKVKDVWYSISIPRGSVKDRAGNQFRSNYILKFKTA